ncbi:hypothetical protein Mapa_011214 [Marchantia paleacea]|nr:hypothetical protein Mapa_011214 [Marchantia paleacea]
MATPVLQRSASSFHRGPSNSGSGSALHRLGSQRSSSLHYDRDGSGPYMANVIENGGEPADASAPAALELFEKDPVFSKFLSDDFNAPQFASEALSSESASTASEKLEEGIHLLEKQLRNEVFFRHDQLLQQLSTLKETESVLAVVRGGVESLQGSVQRVRSEIAEPYKQIKLKSRQLNSLHDTVELLRSVIKALKHLRKLKELMESGSAKADLAKAAQLFNEVDTLRKEADLVGVEVVEEEVPWLMEVGNRIRTEAMKSLEVGMEALNQAEVGSVLQVYYNMGELKSTVEIMINKYKSQATKSVSSALDMKAISSTMGGGGPGGIQRSGTPQLGGTSRAREGLWQRLGTCINQLKTIMLAVWHLQRVLAKKRDPISHSVFLEEVTQAGDSMLTERVWEALVKSFGNQMRSAFTASSFVKETFVLGYPKLLTLIDSLLESIVRETDVKGVPPAIKSEDKTQLIAALEPFQTSYLAKCLTRLSEHVNNMFPSTVRGSIPSQDQIARLISRIQEEIEAAKADGRLTLLVLKEVSKILQLLAERSEYQISTGPDSRQVSGPATPLQLKNFTLCLHLQEVHTRLSTMLAGLPPAASEALSAALGSVYGVALDSITPLFKSMVEKLESCILQIHDQNFSSDGVDYVEGEDSTSKYMDDLQRAITLYRSEFLSKLMVGSSSAAMGGESICSSLARKMASRVLLFFVRHAALVRPLSETGKLRMARDMAELELVVGQSLYPVEQLGAPYHALRAFRPLIFLDTSQLSGSPLLKELPLSVVLHHLYSRGPEELESPMKKLRLSFQQYSLWLDNQGEEQIWKGIRGTLDDYAARVKARGDKEFSPVYPLMLQLGSSLIDHGQGIK